MHSNGKPAIYPGTQPDQLQPFSEEAERAALGAMLIDTDAIINLAPFLQGVDFFVERNRWIYEAVKALNDRGIPADMVTLCDELTRRGHLAEIGGAAYLTSLMNDTPTSIHAEHYGRIVERDAVKRRLIQAASEIARSAYGEESDPTELLARAEKLLLEVSDNRVEDKIKFLKELGGELLDHLDRVCNAQGITGIPTGLTDLDLLLGGLQRSDMIVLAGRPGMGKAQPLDALIKTLFGWKTMAEIQVGDILASPDGKPSKVEGIYPQGLKQVYKVSFKDGRSVMACADHLWKIYSKHWKKQRHLTTQQLIDCLKAKRNRGRLSIDVITGDFGSVKPLPLPPYLLGALLGDGNMTGSRGLRFYTADQEILEKVSSYLDPDYHFHFIGRYDYNLIRKNGATQKGHQGVLPNHYIESLKSLKLWGTDSASKFIPSSYKLASCQDRLELLQGLLDTDGTVEASGTIRYCSKSDWLAKDVQSLVWSLGGVCKKTRKKNSYILSIRHNYPYNLLTLRRKVNRLPANYQYTDRIRLVIESIEPVATKTHCQCIKVSHPNGLYITDNYVTTHNTALATQIAKYAAKRQGIRSLIFSLEMSDSQLMQRLIASESSIPVNLLRTGKISESDWPKLFNASSLLSNLPIAIDDNGMATASYIRSKAIRHHARYGLDLVIIDYIQLIDAEKRGQNRHQEIAEISRACKNLARGLNIPVIVLSQLNRNLEYRGDKRPGLADLRESGAIEADADVVGFIYRDDVYNPDTEFPNLAEIIIAKHRNGPTGTLSVFFKKQCTEFVDLAINRMTLDQVY